MVFIGGPRQVGKTTLAKGFLLNPKGYLNWDDVRAKSSIRNGEMPPNCKLVVFDEIHKYRAWRGLMKGIYDVEFPETQIIVTGSARLDHYRKGGDSLLGRYRYFRLHPFSMREMSFRPNESDLKSLLKFGGFPEPLFSQNEAEHRIWQRDRLSRVIREDLRDLEMVKEISLIEQLVSILPSKVGSPLSIKSICEDLQVDHKTAERWVNILENLYVCFRTLPYGSPKIRAVKKEQKLYLWDWSSIHEENDIGARFENLMAMQLLTHCHLIEDTLGHKMELRYLRDTDKREVDFVVLKDGKPQFAVECKASPKVISPSIAYFSDRTPIPKFYQVHLGTSRFKKGNIEVVGFLDYCKNLEMP